jgi:hypothetical protein
MTRAVWNVLPGIKSCTHWPGAQIWTDYNALARAVFVQHKNFNGITQVTVVKLIIPDAMNSHRRLGRDHEIQCGARWPAIKKWCWQLAGRNSLVAGKRDAHKPARGVGLELEQGANLFGTQIIGQWSLNMERQTSNVHYRMGSWTSNLTIQIAKIEQA